MVHLITLTRLFCSLFFFCLACYHVICLLRGPQKFDSIFLFSLPPSCNSHAASLPRPHLSMVFLSISALLPFLLVMRSIISQSFYAQEATAWLLADADKGWCRGCQAIQIISGIKRSIASFSKSSPIPRPPFNPNLFFHWLNKSGETKSNLRVESFKLYCSPEVIYKNQKCQLFFLLRFSFSGSKCVYVCVCVCMHGQCE